jgi:hypothetical protein
VLAVDALGDERVRFLLPHLPGEVCVQQVGERDRACRRGGLLVELAVTQDELPQVGVVGYDEPPTVEISQRPLDLELEPFGFALVVCVEGLKERGAAEAKLDRPVA